jgi:N-acetylglucosaminyldiphosphoundecaprenol N-acetyl-beta-D-mannosaminyltransferase
MKIEKARLHFGRAVVDVVSKDDVLKYAEEYLRSRRSKPAVIVPVNAQLVNLANRSPRFSEFLNCVELSIADGMSLVLGSRLLGTSLPERIAGADLAVDLCEVTNRLGSSVYLLGGKCNAATGAAAYLKRLYPALKIAGADCPPFGFEKSPEVASEVVRKILAAQPDLLMVCFGAPKQEYWIEDNLVALPCRLVVALGCTFDVLSGQLPRAPSWMQRSGLEWLFRLCMEPKRLWQRYMVSNSYFIWIVLFQAFVQTIRGHSNLESDVVRNESD